MMNKLTRQIATQYHKYIRVWRLLKKPNVEEFKTISKITAIGLLAVGAMGFIISIIVKLIIPIE